MLSRIARFTINLGWSILAKTLKAEIQTISEPTGKAVAEHLLESGEKSVAVLTNSNPDDKKEFQLLLEERKKSTALLGIDAAKKMLEGKINNPTAKVLVDSVFEEVRKAIDLGSFSEEVFLENLAQMETSGQVPEVPK
jgi:hypothetical protein